MTKQVDREPEKVVDAFIQWNQLNSTSMMCMDLYPLKLSMNIMHIHVEYDLLLCNAGCNT